MCFEPRFFVTSAVITLRVRYGLLRQDELVAMGAIRFRFLEKSSPTSAVQNIANALGEDETPPAEVTSEEGRRWVLRELCLSVLVALLSCMNGLTHPPTHKNSTRLKYAVGTVDGAVAVACDACKPGGGLLRPQP